MTAEENSKIATLITQIEVEKNQEKFIALVHELNQILEAKETRLGRVSKPIGLD